VRWRTGQVPDWRNEAAYAPLLAAERPVIAWEWLRRHRRYREAAGKRLQNGAGGPRIVAGDHDAARWHLHAYEDPDLAAPDARPVWCEARHVPVLVADAESDCDGADSFDLSGLSGFASLVRSAAGEQLLLSDGHRNLRLDLRGASLLGGPVRLHYRLIGIERVEGPLLALRQLMSLWRTRRFSRVLHPALTRAHRLVLMLRVHDALASGATQREIASALLSGEAADPRWRVSVPTVRSRVQRLVRAARAMSGEGYRALLGCEARQES
jgi:hypothetical protein